MVEEQPLLPRRTLGDYAIKQGSGHFASIQYLLPIRPWR